MKPQDIESLQLWLEEAREIELALAQNHLQQGKDPYEVLEKFSNRLVQKMLYPCFNLIKLNVVKDYDPQRSQREYKENYLDSVGPKSDHVVDE
ncbi:MAG: hypothetical protein EBU90_07750 [Proteobacteria bacterium]|nr:hypothetical protein [Pseudomonadota bacterium]NBP14092.1 hypothetical protein [bacterium]